MFEFLKILIRTSNFFNLVLNTEYEQVVEPTVELPVIKHHDAVMFRWLHTMHQVCREMQLSSFV